jgi:site-specific DNA-methyltransferase (adenine-specific)
MSRRSLYCSKNASGKYSISHFDNEDGNIRFAEIKHSWQNGKCRYCGASQEVYDRGDDLESHAYEFIHTDNPNTLYNNMTFDVIIGNPPYQLDDGGARASAKPIYHLFVQQAKKLNPRYLCMIIPARWYAGGKGLDDFRDSMLQDERIRCLVDFFDATDCFPGIDISGGVCYFLWNRDKRGKCIVRNIKGNESIETERYLSEFSSFIRFNKAINIIRKIKEKKENGFAVQISSRKPFGIETNSRVRKERRNGDVDIFAYPENGYISRKEITLNQNWIDEYKVYISYAYGERGDFPYLVLGKPFLGMPNSCCTETYLVIGPFSTKRICENVISYIKTKFFRFLVLQRKNTQHATSKVYAFVPLQDFSKPWTDEELYKKYGLTDEEIQFIESMIRPME